MAENPSTTSAWIPAAARCPASTSARRPMASADSPIMRTTGIELAARPAAYARRLRFERPRLGRPRRPRIARIQPLPPFVEDLRQSGLSRLCPLLCRGPPRRTAHRRRAWRAGRINRHVQRRQALLKGGPRQSGIIVGAEPTGGGPRVRQHPLMRAVRLGQDGPTRRLSKPRSRSTRPAARPTRSRSFA